jgi:Flp pilus assembly pilin Flp
MPVAFGWGMQDNLRTHGFGLQSPTSLSSYSESKQATTIVSTSVSKGAFGREGWNGPSIKPLQPCAVLQEAEMKKSVENLWIDQQGQDIAEYAVILAVILVLVVGTIRLVGSNANNAFSSVASSVQ